MKAGPDTFSVWLWLRFAVCCLSGAVDENAALACDAPGRHQGRGFPQGRHARRFPQPGRVRPLCTPPVASCRRPPVATVAQQHASLLQAAYRKLAPFPLTALCELWWGDTALKAHRTESAPTNTQRALKTVTRGAAFSPAKKSSSHGQGGVDYQTHNCANIYLRYPALPCRNAGIASQLGSTIHCGLWKMQELICAETSPLLPPPHTLFPFLFALAAPMCTNNPHPFRHIKTPRFFKHVLLFETGTTSWSCARCFLSCPTRSTSTPTGRRSAGARWFVDSTHRLPLFKSTGTCTVTETVTEPQSMPHLRRFCWKVDLDV